MKKDKYTYYAVYFKRGVGYLTQTFSKEFFKTKTEIKRYLKSFNYGDIIIFDNYNDLDTYINEHWWNF